MAIAEIQLEKDYGVLVITGTKKVLKQFDHEVDAKEFTIKLQKFDNVEFEVLKKAKTGMAGRKYSPAFIRIDAPNLAEGHYYKCVPVAPRKGLTFCTECHDYKKFTPQKDKYGLELVCCPTCGLADTDYHVKIANSLIID